MLQKYVDSADTPICILDIWKKKPRIIEKTMNEHEIGVIFPKNNERAKWKWMEFFCVCMFARKIYYPLLLTLAV